MLKQLPNILESDTRFSSIVVADPSDGTIRSMTVEDHYAALKAIELSPQVPLATSAVFERGRNAFLYAWFVYDLAALAEGQAYAALEMALRERLGGPNARTTRGLGEQLQAAYQSGALDNLPIMHVGCDEDRKVQLEQLIRRVRRARNHLAHGTESVSTPGVVLDSLSLCASLINHLYSSHRTRDSRKNR